MTRPLALHDRCPVCRTPLVQESCDRDEGRVLEESLICPEGCYTYNYNYGNVEEYVGQEVLYSAWCDSNKNRATHEKNVAEAAERARGPKQHVILLRNEGKI